MKNPYEVLRVKEQKVCQLRRETEALRFVIGLVDDKEAGAKASPANATPDARPAVYLVTNSGRLEVVVGGTPRLRFDGQMCMAVEVTRTENAFRISVPTPQPTSA